MRGMRRRAAAAAAAIRYTGTSYYRYGCTIDIFLRTSTGSTCFCTAAAAARAQCGDAPRGGGDGGALHRNRPRRAPRAAAAGHAAAFCGRRQLRRIAGSIAAVRCQHISQRHALQRSKGGSRARGASGGGGGASQHAAAARAVAVSAPPAPLRFSSNGRWYCQGSPDRRELTAGAMLGVSTPDVVACARGL
jgi:hypothetical protein